MLAVLVTYNLIHCDLFLIGESSCVAPYDSEGDDDIEIDDEVESYGESDDGLEHPLGESESSDIVYATDAEGEIETDSSSGTDEEHIPRKRYVCMYWTCITI